MIVNTLHEADDDDDDDDDDDKDDDDMMMMMIIIIISSTELVCATNQFRSSKTYLSIHFGIVPRLCILWNDMYVNFDTLLFCIPFTCLYPIFFFFLDIALSIFPYSQLAAAVLFFHFVSCLVKLPPAMTSDLIDVASITFLSLFFITSLCRCIMLS
jgi:hypothetical protein